jgi:hypothetical protein
VQCTIFCRCEGCSNKEVITNSQNCAPSTESMEKLGNL